MVTTGTRAEIGIEALFQLRDSRFARMARMSRLATEAKLMSGRVALLSPLVTWLPLLVLSWIGGVAWAVPGTPVGFLEDYLPHGRYLLTIPVLIAFEAIVGPQLQATLLQFQQCRIVQSADLPRLQEIVLEIVDLWRNRLVHLTIIVVAYSATLLEYSQTITSAHWEGTGENVTAAGVWQLLVSQPLMRFLVYRWLFRMIIWGRALWKIASMPLALIPEHPDRAGGLSFLGAGQAAFAFFGFACGVQIAALIADQCVHGGANLMQYRAVIAGYAILCLVVVFVPLTAFSKPMSAAQQEEQLRMTRWIGYAARVARGKLDADTDTEILEDLRASEVSGVNDAGQVFVNVQNMRPFPFERRHLITVAGAALLPFAPLVLLVMPLKDVVAKIVSMVL